MGNFRKKNQALFRWLTQENKLHVIRGKKSGKLSRNKVCFSLEVPGRFEYGE